LNDTPTCHECHLFFLWRGLFPSLFLFLFRNSPPVAFFFFLLDSVLCLSPILSWFRLRVVLFSSHSFFFFTEVVLCRLAGLPFLRQNVDCFFLRCVLRYSVSRALISSEVNYLPRFVFILFSFVSERFLGRAFFMPAAYRLSHKFLSRFLVFPSYLRSFCDPFFLRHGQP